MTVLLDVNVLISLIDPTHNFHERAHAWFESEAEHDWATCPIVENGVVRIISQPNCRNRTASVADAASLVSRVCRRAGHQFWADDLSLVNSPLVAMERIRTPAQVADIYLLELAVSKGGRLATLDRRLWADAVVGGKKALRLIAP